VEENSPSLFDVAARGVYEGVPRIGLGAHPSANGGSKLCPAIVGPSRVRSHLSEGMQITALCHTERGKGLTTL
jgi:enoyl-CoA hydratase/carnithine racemase